MTVAGTRYKFSIWGECTSDMVLINGYFKVARVDNPWLITIPCKALDTDTFCRANKLLDEVSHFTDPDHVIIFNERPAKLLPSDSDKRPDDAVVPAFNSASLAVAHL